MRARVCLLSCVLVPLLVPFVSACDDAGTKSPEKAAEDNDNDNDNDKDEKAEGATDKPAPTEPKAPSNEAARELTQLWATPSGQPTGRVAAVRDGRVYAVAGAHVEFGTPANNLLALEADTGKILWTHAADEPLTVSGASDKLLDVEVGEGLIILAADTGKEVTPTKADSDATKGVAKAEAPAGCEQDGAKLRCADWAIEESGALVGLRQGGEGAPVCYAITGSREVRCRAASTGDLEFAIAVPAVPEVKEPGAVNFSFHVVGERVFIGNYDGTVLAFGPK